MSDTNTSQSSGTSKGGGLLQPILITLSLVALIVASYAAAQVKQLRAELEQVTSQAERFDAAVAQKRAEAAQRAERAATFAAKTKAAQTERAGAQKARAARPANAAPTGRAAAAPGAAKPTAEAKAATQAKAQVGAKRAEELIKTLGADKEKTTAVLQALGVEGRARTRLNEAAKERGLEAKEVKWRKDKLRARTDAQVKALVDDAQFKRYLELRANWEKGT